MAKSMNEAFQGLGFGKSKQTQPMDDNAQQQPRSAGFNNFIQQRRSKDGASVFGVPASNLTASESDIESPNTTEPNQPEAGQSKSGNLYWIPGMDQPIDMDSLPQYGPSNPYGDFSTGEIIRSLPFIRGFDYVFNKPGYDTLTKKWELSQDWDAKRQQALQDIDIPQELKELKRQRDLAIGGGMDPDKVAPIPSELQSQWDTFYGDAGDKPSIGDFSAEDIATYETGSGAPKKDDSSASAPRQFLKTDPWSYYTDANGNNVNYTQDDVDRALQARFDAIYGGKSGTFTDIIDFMSRATPQQVKQLFEWSLDDDPYGTGALVAALMDSFSNDTYGNFGYEDLWTEDGKIDLGLLTKIIEGERKTNVLPDMIQLISQGGDGAAAALSKLIGSNGYFLDDLGSYLASQLGQGYGAAYDNDIDALTQMISTMTPEDYDKATRQAQLANMMMLVSSGAGGSDLSKQAVKEMQRLMGDLDYEFGDVSPDFSIENDYLDMSNPDWRVTGVPDYSGFGQYDYGWFDNPTYDSLPLAWIAALSDEARPISKKKTETAEA